MLIVNLSNEPSNQPDLSQQITLTSSRFRTMNNRAETRRPSDRTQRVAGRNIVGVSGDPEPLEPPANSCRKRKLAINAVEDVQVAG